MGERVPASAGHGVLLDPQWRSAWLRSLYICSREDPARTDGSWIAAAAVEDRQGAIGKG